MRKTLAILAAGGLLALSAGRVLRADPPAAPARPPVDLSGESLALFTNRVQPVLMNVCASCHATNRGGAFKLTRCYDGQANRRATQENLTAVLDYVRADQPELSPLLIK